MKKMSWIRSAVLLSLVALTGSGVAWAGKVKTETVTLAGVGDWAATELFRSTDIESELTEWSGLDELRFYHGSFAENTGDELFLVVYGRVDSTATTLTEHYTGIVKVDLSGAAPTFAHVLQELATDASEGTSHPSMSNSLEGTIIDSLHVVAGTGGGVTEDDLLALRVFNGTKAWDSNAEEWTGDVRVEVVRYPADTSSDSVDVSARETLFTYDAQNTPQTVAARNQLVTDSAGNIYVTGEGLLDENGTSLEGTVRKLTWDGTSYSDSELVSGVGIYLRQNSGDLFVAASSASGPAVLRVTSGGSTSVYSSIGDDSFDGLLEFAFDGSGTLRSGVYDSGTSGIDLYITEAPSGGGTSFDARIADLAVSYGLGLATRTAGGLFVESPVLERTTSKGSTTTTWKYDAVFALTESAGSGAGGGGGSGNGKGKNK